MWGWAKKMVETIVPARNTNGFVFASSDGEFEQNLREAIEASNDDYAFQTQLQEALSLSTLTFAYDLQLADIAQSSPVTNPSSSKDVASSSTSKDEASSSSKDEKECVPVNYYEQYNGCGGEKGENSRGKEVDPGLEGHQSGVQKAMPLDLCGICYDDSAAEMFEGLRCLHRFCHPCMTKYIHTQLEQKRRQIYCPDVSCGEPLTPRECRYFLPGKIIEAWSGVPSEAEVRDSPAFYPSVASLEAEIPELQNVCCPFRDCSSILMMEDVAALIAAEIVNAECPFCYRMFCVKCMVPWHADLNCEEFKIVSA